MGPNAKKFGNHCSKLQPNFLAAGSGLQPPTIKSHLSKFKQELSHHPYPLSKQQVHPKACLRVKCCFHPCEPPCPSLNFPSNKEKPFPIKTIAAIFFFQQDWKEKYCVTITAPSLLPFGVLKLCLRAQITCFSDWFPFFCYLETSVERQSFLRTNVFHATTFWKMVWFFLFLL